MATISSAAPQFLVSELSNALAFYEQSLGFRCDFVYEGYGYILCFSEAA